MRCVHLHKAAVRNRKRLADEADAEATCSHGLLNCACTRTIRTFRPRAQDAVRNGDVTSCKHYHSAPQQQFWRCETCALLQLRCFIFQKGSQEFKSPQPNLCMLFKIRLLLDASASTSSATLVRKSTKKLACNHIQANIATPSGLRYFTILSPCPS